MYPVSGNAPGSRDKALFYLVLASAALYVIACVVRIYEVSQGIDVLKSGGQPGEYLSHANVAHDASLAAFTLLLLLLGLFIAFHTTLGKRLGNAGRAVLHRSPAFTAWRIGIIASVLLSVFTNPLLATGSSLSEMESDLDLDMVYYVLRAVLACVYIWCAFSLRKKALQLATSAPPAPRRSRPTTT